MTYKSKINTLKLTGLVCILWPLVFYGFEKLGLIECGWVLMFLPIVLIVGSLGIAYILFVLAMLFL